MILMRTIILSILAFGLAGSLMAGDEEIVYSQTYIVFLDGARAGREVVTEKIDDSGDLVIESENEIYVDDGLETKRMAYTTRMVLKKKSLKLKSYVYSYLTGDSYEVTVKGDKITRALNRAGETSVVTADYKNDTVFLDFDVFHQYDYLVRKYDSDKGQRQLYSDFIPVIGTDIPVALTYLGDSNLSTIRGNLKLKNYKIEYVGLRNGAVSFDSENRLVRLVMPDQNMEVLRQDIVPANR